MWPCAGMWPGVFVRYAGHLNSLGRASPELAIPNDATLVGIRLHSAFVALESQAPDGVRTISNTHSFSITQ